MTLKKRKAQSSVELIIILAIGLAVLLIIFQIYNKTQTSFSGQLESKKARTLVDTLADAAEMVYQQGIGARTRLFVTIPENVNSINISDTLLLVNSAAGGGTRDTYFTFDFNVSGTIPIDAGNTWVYIEAKDGYVSFTQNVTLTCSDAGGVECCGSGETCGGSSYGGSDCGTICCSQTCDAAADTTDPEVTLNSPAHNSITTNENTTFDCSATDNIALSTIDFWANFTGSFIEENSCSVSGTSASCTPTETIANGTYRWNCNATDSSGNDAFASSDFTYTVNITAVADTTPPSSITSLANQSATLTSIYWTWTNPVDADFSQAIVFLDGSNLANTSNAFYNATGLSAETNYNLSVQTKDTSGNVNTSDVSSIAITLTSPDTLQPSSVTNLANQSATIDSIYWTWTNPVDADFSQAIVYIGSTNLANTTNAFYNATSLTADTDYTIKVHTKDTSNNVNDTDVTDTGRTQTPPPAFSTAFFDDFTRANSDDIGGSWTETGTEWDILSNRAHADNCDSPGDQIETSNIDLSSSSNATLTFDWEYVNFDSGECLNLDLNDGLGWQTDVFTACSSATNSDLTGSETIQILDSITLTSTVQVRFDCLSSHPNEEGYIDNVNVSGFS